MAFRRYLCALVLFGALEGLTACDDEPAVAYRPPACEPAGELLVERALKEGFRHLHFGRTTEASAAFDRALKLAPGHPEAQSGRREARRLSGSKSDGRRL